LAEHGFEAPDVRQQRSKPVEGTITFKAYRAEKNIMLELSDDGTGIDFQNMNNKAMPMGLFDATDPESISEPELINLIIGPNQKVFNKYGIEVEIHTTLHKSTSITLSLPELSQERLSLLVRDQGACLGKKDSLNSVCKHHLWIEKFMTIELDTKDDAQQLVFKDIKNFGSAGCRCRILVSSYGFMCDRPFEFNNVGQFLKDLRKMHEELTGEARLSQEYEDNFVELKVDGLGRIYVRGQVVHYADIDQSLEFGFVTDQTCLARLIRDFEKLV
jgi:hypothetical protein